MSFIQSVLYSEVPWYSTHYYRIISNIRGMNILQIAVCKGMCVFYFANGSLVMYISVIQEYIREDVFARRPVTSQNW